jgi:hypothetical protein
MSLDSKLVQFFIEHEEEIDSLEEKRIYTATSATSGLPRLIQFNTNQDTRILFSESEFREFKINKSLYTSKLYKSLK